MLELGEEPQYNVRNTRKSSGSLWSTYRRLLGYTFAYKGRLTLSILFAILVAVSTSSIILTVGGAVNLLYWSPPAAEGEAVVDPAASAAEEVAGIAEKLAPLFGAAVAAWDDRFLDTVAYMRDNQMQALLMLSGFVIVMALIGGVARFLQEYFAGTIGANISVTVGKEMYDNVLRLSMDFYDKHASGEILARFTNDIFMINRGLASVLVKVIREPIKAVFFLGVALSVDVPLTLIGLCVLPPIAYVIIKIGKKVKKSVRRSLEKIASMATVINETFSGIAIIKGYSMEEHEARRLNGEISKLRRYLIQMVRADAAVGPLTEFIMALGIVAFVLVTGHRLSSGLLSAGDIVRLYAALAFMMDPVRKLSAVNNMIQTSVASAERIFEFIDMKPSVAEAPGARSIGRLESALRFEDVRFSYDGKTGVLNGLNLDIKRGEMVAIVGFSGGGKSTLTKLIPRFYDVTGGRILIDGVDIREATFESLRGQIGMVPQEPILFNLPIRENIAFGKPDFTDAQIEAAARGAHAHDFILKTPQGYDTVLGESGSNLSGGQRQRLAIARALIKDPAILILDEATSNLDSESERAIQQALAEFVVGRTTIVIAHRLSTVQRADRIVVLDEGRVAEQGTHRELLERGGIYRRLHDIQFAQSGEDGAA